MSAIPQYACVTLHDLHARSPCLLLRPSCFCSLYLEGHAGTPFVGCRLLSGLLSIAIAHIIASITINNCVIFISFSFLCRRVCCARAFTRAWEIKCSSLAACAVCVRPILHPFSSLFYSSTSTSYIFSTSTPYHTLSLSPLSLYLLYCWSLYLLALSLFLLSTSSTSMSLRHNAYTARPTAVYR